MIGIYMSIAVQYMYAEKIPLIGSTICQRTPLHRTAAKKVFRCRFLF